MKTIAGPAMLYAHAIAIEREAAARYAELAAHMRDLGNDGVAELFAALARMEQKHLETLVAEVQEMALPGIDASEYAWLDSGAPETAAREFVFRMMTPRDALAIALAAERRAQAFFLRMQRLGGDPATRTLAQDMAAEESDHIALVERALAQVPDPAQGWSLLFEREPAGAQPVAHWHAEHVYFRRLLDLLEQQLDLFHAAEQPNYELMLDVIYYLRHFSDELHHPSEDVAFACLAHRRPGMALPLARLLQEHRVIAHTGERLERRLQQAAGGAFVGRAGIEALAATYLVYYRSHIAREEKDVLPEAARTLSAEDWQAVRQARQSPAAEAAAVRLQALRRQIAEQHARDA